MIPEPLSKIEELLKKWNDVDGMGTWRQMDDLHVLSRVQVTETDLNIDSSSTLVVKGFINTKTGEMRFYSAKTLDVPNRKRLWKPA